MGNKRLRVRVSSSVENFKEKIKERITYEGDYLLIFGLYHWVDYLKFIFTPGKKRVFWCGADILSLTTRWAKRIRLVEADHVCENQVEQDLLAQFGIDARIQPVILTDYTKYKSCFRPSRWPQVFLTCHPGREGEYGLPTVEKLAKRLPFITFHIYGIESFSFNTPKNMVFHGFLSEKEFDRQISHCHAALRLNSFDGFAETLAKSILMGQYPISRIKYPGIDSFDSFEELVEKLNGLKKKRVPNPTRDWWYNKLKENI